MEQTPGMARRLIYLHTLGPVAACLLALAAAGPGWAQELRPETLLTSEGVGVILNQNQARARDQAIVNALRGCVEQAVVDLVDPELILNNYPLITAELFDRAEGYVKSYRIFHEEAASEEHLFRVAVQATVARSLLKSDLEAMGLYLERRGKPKVMLFIEEVAAFDGDQPPAENRSQRIFLEHFRSRGFPVAENPEEAGRMPASDTQAAAALGRRSGAQVVLVGKTVLRRIVSVSGGGKPSYQATVSVRAVDAGEANVVAVGSESAVALPGEASGPGEVIQDAASKAASFMADQLLIQWKVEDTRANTIALVVDKVSVADLAQFKTGLRNHISGVRRLVQRRYGPEGALLEVDYTGDAALLAQAIGSTRFGLFNVQVVAAGPQRIDIQVVP